MRLLLLACVVAGCGGDEGKSEDAAVSTDGPPRDAAVDAALDAPTAVRRVTCPSPMPAALVSTSNFAFTPPLIMVKRDDIVRFAPESLHRVVPHASKMTDPGLRSGSTGEVRCLQFTELGTYNYQCGPHPAMEGVVMVTN
jgi:plastocyanin